MTTKHLIHKKWAQALVLVLLLSSCGGTSDPATTGSTATTTGTTTTGGSGTVELINGIPVPPEPDPVANNATLAGIDANGNGVRDDVERVIANTSSTHTEFSDSMKIAKIYQAMLTGKSILQEDFTFLMCHEKTGLVEKSSINTDLRLTEYYKNNLSDEGGFSYNSGDCK